MQACKDSEKQVSRISLSPHHAGQTVCRWGEYRHGVRTQGDRHTIHTGAVLRIATEREYYKKAKEVYLLHD